MYYQSKKNLSANDTSAIERLDVMSPEKHIIEQCPQEKRLERLEMIMDGLVKQLAASNETLVVIRELLNGKIEKYDGHVESGERWRNDITKIMIAACLTGFATTLGFGIKVGMMASDINRLQALHPFGSPIAPIIGVK